MDAIIFDVDGTLWDSTESVANAYNTAIGKYDLNVKVDSARLKQLFGKPMDVIFMELLPKLTKEEREQITDECMELEHIGLMADSDELIAQYQYEKIGEAMKILSQKYPLYIVSNCQCGYIEIFLERTGYGPYVKGHLCFGDTGTSKGQTILRLMREQNLKDPVYVGDTQGDADACAEAGIPMVFCEYGFGMVKESKYRISKPMDLVDLFM